MPREPLLIVDDDPFVLGLLVHVAESRGLAVVGVASSDEAVAAAGTQPFGAAIVDLQLGADSGLDVIKRLRALDPTLEAIVISADRRLSSAIESIDFSPHHFDDFLYDQLRDALENVGFYILAGHAPLIHWAQPVAIAFSRAAALAGQPVTRSAANPFPSPPGSICVPVGSQTMRRSRSTRMSAAPGAAVAAAISAEPRPSRPGHERS